MNSAVGNFKKACNVGCIKDHTMEDAITVMLYCFSTSADGDLMKIAQVSNESPYITIELDDLDPKHRIILRTFGFLIRAAAEVPKPD